MSYKEEFIAIFRENIHREGADRLLDWLEETGRGYPIRIHSMNPVGVDRMRCIIRKNDWVELR